MVKNNKAPGEKFTESFLFKQVFANAIKKIRNAQIYIASKSKPKV
jgi:hypothetical protein